MGPVRDTSAMIAGMDPVADTRIWHFCTTPDIALSDRLRPQALAYLQEAEGCSLILTEALAQAHGFDTSLPMTRITLGVHSALEGVGLTAAVATALAEAGIACNMVAGFHHDHVFVPADDAARAMDILGTLATREAGT